MSDVGLRRYRHVGEHGHRHVGGVRHRLDQTKSAKTPVSDKPAADPVELELADAAAHAPRMATDSARNIPRPLPNPTNPQ